MDSRVMTKQKRETIKKEKKKNPNTLKYYFVDLFEL